MATSVPGTSVPAAPGLRWKARSVCFTLHDYTDQDLERVRALCKASKYAVFGQEVTPTTGRRHLQGYVSFKNPRSGDSVKKDINDKVHLEVAKGNAEQNRTYCTKEGKFEEFGELPKQGERTDWAQAVKALQEGQDVADVVVEQPQLLPAIRSLERFKTLTLKPLHRDVTVIVLYGDAGTGKSRWAYASYPDLYSKSRGEWWDGYAGQKAILLDDYYGYMPYSELLRVLDRYPYHAPVKGGFVWAQWDTVIITSNKPPSQWYQQGLTPALRRRLNRTFYLSGIDNAPDCPTLIEVSQEQSEASAPLDA